MFSVGFEGFPLQLALDPCPGIVDPGMRISNQTPNLSFSQICLARHTHLLRV